MTRATRKRRELKKQRRRATKRATLQASAPAAPGVTAPGCEVQLTGAVLNPGDPGWVPSPKFLNSAAGQGWWFDPETGHWCPPEAKG